MSSTPPEALSALGLRAPQWAEAVRQGVPAERVARVAEDRRIHFVLYAAGGDCLAECRPELLRDARKGLALRPVVGDWVVFAPPAAEKGLATIEQVLPRVSQFRRKRAREELREQVVAANIDRVFLLMSLTEDFSPRRIERYLSLTHEAGADAVILLTKPDLAEDAAAAQAAAQAVSGGAPVLRLDPREADALAKLEPYLTPRETAAFLGSSGVGKSTLINLVLGDERQRAGEVRRDGKGRHTTSTRHLFRAPGGGLVIDTPGMRELGLWDAEEGVRETFDEVAGFAEGCRFRDCTHDSEPGCEVRGALARGELDPARVESYRKLSEELRELDRDREVGRKRRRRGRGPRS